MLYRHGARYPTSGAAPSAFAGRLHAQVDNGTTPVLFWGELEFMNSWTYKLGAEELTPFGRSQNFQLGVEARQLYGKLLNNFTQTVSTGLRDSGRLADQVLPSILAGISKPQSDPDYLSLSTIPHTTSIFISLGLHLPTSLYWELSPNFHHRLHLLTLPLPFTVTLSSPYLPDTTTLYNRTPSQSSEPKVKVRLP
jgi:hypothetical protein